MDYRLLGVGMNSGLTLLTEFKQAFLFGVYAISILYEISLKITDWFFLKIRFDGHCFRFVCV